MVLASKPVASVMRFAARPVGAHNRSLNSFRCEYPKDGFHNGGFTDAGTAGHNQHFGHKSEPDCSDLTFGKPKSNLLLDPREGLVRID